MRKKETGQCLLRILSSPEGWTWTWMCVLLFKLTFFTSRTVSTSTAAFILGKSKPFASSPVKTQAHVETQYSTQTHLHAPAFRIRAVCSYYERRNVLMLSFPKRKRVESKSRLCFLVYWSKPSWTKQQILWFAYSSTDRVWFAGPVCLQCWVVPSLRCLEMFNWDSPFSFVSTTTAPAFTSFSRASVCK